MLRISPLFGVFSMHTRKYIVSIDCGTQSSRALVWDPDGNPVSCGQSGYEILNPRLGWYEQDAGKWWPATCDAIRQALKQVDKGEIAALGITHQRETFVPIDSDGRPLRYALPHMDERCAKQVDFVKKKVGAKKIQRITGKYPSYVFSLYDILWIIDNEPHIAEKVYKYLDVQSFLQMHLIDRIVTSYVSADPTSLINIKKLSWDLDLMRTLGLSVDQFPELCPPCVHIGDVSRRAARETGLPEGLPVIAGAGDGICASIGTNTTNKHRIFFYIGTWTVLGGFSPVYVIDMAFRTLLSAIPGSYSCEANVSGGFVISWFLENFRNSEKYWEELAAKIQPGSDGLFTVPYWLGTLAPYWDPGSRGVTIGWSGIHTTAHFYRSILEGVAFEHRLLTEKIARALDSRIERLVFVGGGAKSALWGQIVADVFNLPLYTSQTVESSALGAAILAAYGIGIYPSVVEAAERMTHLEKRYEPDPDKVKVYDRMFNRVYKNIYPQVKPSIDELEMPSC
jgi:sugar (pentulose or hexulose) kinase